MVCAVEEIEKSTLFWGKGGKCDQNAQKSNFTTKCLNTFVPHCSFQFRGRKTYIGFGFVGRRHLGLVNDFFSEAISFYGALFFLPTVACSFGLVLRGLCRVLKNSLVMSLYNLLYVQHATVAQFESVSVEDFPQFMASREALINKPQKLSSYFALDIFIVK